MGVNSMDLPGMLCAWCANIASYDLPALRRVVCYVHPRDTSPSWARSMGFT